MIIMIMIVIMMMMMMITLFTEDMTKLTLSSLVSFSYKKYFIRGII